MKTKKILLGLFILSLLMSPNLSLAQSEEVFRAQLQAQIDILFQEVMRLMAILAERNNLELEEEEESGSHDSRYIPASDMTGDDEESEVVDVSTTTQDAWYPELECQQREAQKLPHLRLMCP